MAVGLATAVRVDAAFVAQEVDHRVHDGIAGAADQCRALTLLGYQIGRDEPVEMVRERRATPVRDWMAPTGSPSGSARTKRR